MSTIITRNSANSGSTPASLVQGELAINVTDGRLFYGSGSGSTVKEFGVTASYALNALTASYAVSASYEINYETSSSYADFAVSASHAAQADNAAAIDIFSFSSPVDSYLLMSNVIAATGVAVGGDTDLRYNASTNTLTAVNISATSITGSLLGTASYASQALSASHAVTAITSSYPIAASSSTIYSVIPPALSSGKNNAILLGANAGTGTTTIYNSNFIGYEAGRSATNAYQSNFIGVYAGSEAIAADNSNFIGLFAGYKAVSASFSTLIGWQAGYTPDPLTSIGNNNIIIGTNITLPSKSRDSINLGGIIFATGSYSSIAGNPYSGSQYNIGKVGINKVTPDYTLDVSGSGNYSNGLTVTGSVTATSFTGSLLGTASYATQALSSSYALNATNATTASYVLNAVSASFASTASFVQNAQTASYVLQAVSSSFASTASFVQNAQTASYVLQAVSASFATSSSRAVSASFATTASYVLNAISASFASTASSVNTLNQNVLISGSLTVGTSTAGASENTLTLGPRDNGSEGGQIMLQAPGGTYTSASMWDNYANQTRLLRGSNAGSDAMVASFNMHTKQMQLPAYNSPTAFTGTTLVGLLGFDNSGNLITTTTSSGGGGGGVTITNNVDNYVITATGTANTINGESNMQFNGSSLSITGQITSSGAIISTANGAMYFRGGDDAEFWDINVANTVGIYGQQDQTVGGLKLGSAGATLYSSGSRFGIGTTAPVATLDVNGNLFVASGITGSLQGTASYATQALSSSFASTASYVLQAVSASFATTASYALNAVSASHALTASFITASNVYGPYGSNSVISASYALNGGVTQLLAGPNITLSPTTGKGQVTISSTGGSGPFFNTATGSYGSFYDTTTQTNPVANIPRSMSFNTTDITNGVSISGSTSPFNTYIKTENPGVYNIQFSAQVDKTDGGTDDVVIWLRKNGIDLTDTATTLTLPTNNSKVVAAWNWFVNSAANDYYQIIWYSADIDLRLLAETAGGGHPGIPSVILTVNRVDQFLSNTGSFSGSFTGTLTGTASYATQALSSSFAQTASYVLNAVSSSFASTASFVQNAQTASYVLQAVSASYALNATNAITAQTASYVLQAVSSSFATLAQMANTASYVVTAQTASYVLQAVSASFASTASSVNQLNQIVNVGAGIQLNNTTADISATSFTAGGGAVQVDGILGEVTATTFIGNLNGTASYATQALSASYAPSTPTFPYTGSAIISGSLEVTGSFTVQDSIDAANKILIGSGPIPGSTEDSINWDSRTLFDSNGNFSVRWGTLRSLYDTNASQSIDWNNRLLKFDNGPGDYTVNWNAGILRDTTSKNSLDWQNRQLKDTNGNEILNWQSGVTITGSAIVSGSFESTGSFSVQTYNPLLAATATAIELNDTTRRIYDTSGLLSIDALFRTATYQNLSPSIDWQNSFLYDLIGNTSLDWGIRSLLDSSNTVAANWDAFALNYKIETYTYLKRFIDSGTQELFSDVPTVAFNYEGEVIEATLDASVNQFDLVYLETDSKWYPVTQGTANCTKLLGICAETGARPKVILEGSITVNDGTFTDTPLVQSVNFGLPIYIRESSGYSMSTVVPTTAGQYVRILGHAYYQNTANVEYWTMKFRPSNEWIVL